MRVAVKSSLNRHSRCTVTFVESLSAGENQVEREAELGIIVACLAGVLGGCDHLHDRGKRGREDGYCLGPLLRILGHLGRWKHISGEAPHACGERMLNDDRRRDCSHGGAHIWMRWSRRPDRRIWSLVLAEAATVSLLRIVGLVLLANLTTVLNKPPELAAFLGCSAS